MIKRSDATGEDLRKWSLEDVKCSKQNDGVSCGIFTLMVRTPVDYDLCQ